MPPPSTLTPALLSAITSADLTTLQSVLISMCSTSTECAAAVSSLLLVTRVSEIVNLDSDSDNDSKAPARKKRKQEQPLTAEVSRYKTCSACHKRFDVERNAEDACQLHDGDLEVDPDQFPDDNDIQAGEEIDVNSDWRVDAFPDGFIWTCCEENAKGPPCVVQRHEILERT